MIKTTELVTIKKMKSPKSNSLIFAAIISIVLLFVSYCLKNSPKPTTGKEAVFIKSIEKTRTEKDKNKNKEWLDSILMVNTCYDLDLVNHYDMLLFEPDKVTNDTTMQSPRKRKKRGNQAVVNRKDLFLFLKQIKDYNYKYIILDIQLDDLNDSSYNDTSSSVIYNDSLKNLILKMKRICIPRSELFSLDKKLYPIAGWAYYRISYKESGFIKYPLTKDETPSMALMAYDNKGIDNYFNLLYFDKHRLCQNNLIVQFSNLPLSADDLLNPHDSTGDKKSKVKFIDLASDHWRELLSRELVANKLVSNNIILIGDYFSNDIHDTFAGQQPGVLIHANAYINLKDGKHLVNWWVVLLLFAVYYAFSYYIICGKKLREVRIIGPILKPLLVFPLVNFFVSFISFGLVFLLLSCCLYSFADYYYSILLPSLWFSVLPHIIQYYQESKSNRKKQKIQ